MKIVPYENLTKLQQEIAGWAGDKDGGCEWEYAVEWLVEEDGYNELIIKKEIVNMIKSEILVASIPSCQLYYPDWRPNESRGEYDRNKIGYYSYGEEDIIVSDREIEISGYVITSPDGKETFCRKLQEIEQKTGLSARLVSKFKKGFGDITPYKLREGSIKETIKGGPRTIKTKTFVPASKEPFDYEKAILNYKVCISDKEFQKLVQDSVEKYGIKTVEKAIDDYDHPQIEHWIAGTSFHHCGQRCFIVETLEKLQPGN